MSGKVITIAQQKGGAGKTTVAIHLAIALWQKGKSVAVIDIDPQKSLSTWFSLREDRFGQGYTGIHCHAVAGWRVSSEITRLKREMDIIIIDSPPHTETEAKTAIRAADLVLIPVQPSPTDVWATKATLALAAKEHIPACILLNRMAANSKLAKEITAELPQTLETYLGNRVAFASCLLEGRAVTETDPASQAAKEVKAFASEVWHLLTDSQEATEIPEQELAEM